MSTWTLAPGRRFVAEAAPAASPEQAREAIPEEVLFDKAEQAESLENMRLALEELDRRIDAAASGPARDGDRAGRKEGAERLQASEEELRGAHRPGGAGGARTLGAVTVA